MNNNDLSEANDLCDDLTAKLKRQNKLIKMADRSPLGWDTVAQCEADPIASDSDHGKKIRQAENRALTKQKSKKSNKPTFRFPSQRPIDQQFRIDGQHNGFTPPISTKLQPQISIKQLHPRWLLSTRGMV